MTTMAMAPALRTSATRPRQRAATTAAAPVSREARPAALGLASAQRRTEPSRGGVAGLHLTGRGRAALWLLAFLLVACAVLGTSRAAADGPQPAQQVERHVVLPGETMWQIASGVAEPGQDVRDVVLELVRLNELPSAGLMAGQTILVPVD